jgi:hypothetical protein
VNLEHFHGAEFGKSDVIRRDHVDVFAEELEQAVKINCNA